MVLALMISYLDLLKEEQKLCFIWRVSSLSESSPSNYARAVINNSGFAAWHAAIQALEAAYFYDMADSSRMNHRCSPLSASAKA